MDGNDNNQEEEKQFLHLQDVLKSIFNEAVGAVVKEEPAYFEALLQKWMAPAYLDELKDDEEIAAWRASEGIESLDNKEGMEAFVKFNMQRAASLFIFLGFFHEFSHFCRDVTEDRESVVKRLEEFRAAGLEELREYIKEDAAQGMTEEAPEDIDQYAHVHAKVIMKSVDGLIENLNKPSRLTKALDLKL